ncbi:MAG: ribosome maturation factor RimP [Desulfotomaculum sp.]|nr:ribosome maturation factor RimP [Desulfotomaculum sp.]
MIKATIDAQVAELMLPLVASTNLELVEVTYTKEGSQWYLRVFIDKPGGINIADCQEISGKLEEILDEKDFILQAYILEVSSPGIERSLKKPADYIGGKK